MKKDAKAVRQLLKMLDFMGQNRLFIHPTHSLVERAKAISGAGHCLCDSRRKECPCAQALREIKAESHCACKIFFSLKGVKEFYSGEKSKD